MSDQAIRRRDTLMGLLAMMLPVAGRPALALPVLKVGGPVAPGRVVTDDVTGLAIGGYDPVAYFTDGRALAGRQEYEVLWNGAFWHFANQGNRDIFAEAPEVYAPAYGGHCATSAAHGRLVEGDPTLFAVRDGRLFLFHDQSLLAAFQDSPGEVAAAADTAWPDLQAGLMR